jgi:hypothetical protein
MSKTSIYGPPAEPSADLGAFSDGLSFYNIYYQVKFVKSGFLVAQKRAEKEISKDVNG